MLYNYTENIQHLVSQWYNICVFSLPTEL